MSCTIAIAGKGGTGKTTVAALTVLRCTPVEEGEGDFAVACQISRILG